MTRIAWNEPGDRVFEAGADRGVLYPMMGLGVPWNGLISVTENVSGGEAQSYYFDGVKYFVNITGEDFQGTIEAYTYPDEFSECDGLALVQAGFFASRQPRKSFGLCYRTGLGNDLEDLEYGYKLHLVYNAMATPSTKFHGTLNDSPEASTFSWTIEAVPVPIALFKPTAHFVIDSTTMPPGFMSALEDTLYGSSGGDSSLLMPNDIVAILLDFITEPITEPV